MLDVMFDFARDFARLDTGSWTILLVMIGWAVLLIQIALDSKSHTVLFIPGMLLGGMGAFYVSRLTITTLASSKDINAILLSIVGISVGFVATILIMHGLHWLADQRRPLTLENRS